MEGELELRECVEGDRERLSEALQRAFTQFNLSVGADPRVDFATLEDANHAVNDLLLSENTYGLTAIHKPSSRPVGGAFLHSAGDGLYTIGPMFVDPDFSNSGVGKAIMSRIVDKAKASNATSIRLLQVATNVKSFSLYTKLGFRPVECVSYYEGLPNQNFKKQGTESSEVKIRMMEESDVFLCSNLHERVMGYGRDKEILEEFQASPTNAWVAEKDGVIQAYTVGHFITAHTISVSEEILKILLEFVFSLKNQASLAMHIPGRLYPFLLSWAVNVGLHLRRHCWVMVIGNYQEPKAGSIWFPSILG